MGFISSIFCGSSDNHQNGTSASGSTHHGSTASSGPNSHHSKLRQKTSTPPTTTNINTATSANSQTNNGGRPTHKASPATSNGNLKKQRSSHSKNTISTKTTTTRTKETVGANAHNGSSSSSSSSSRKQVKVANAHAPTNGYGNSQGTTTPTPRTSTSSSLSVTNEKSKMAKNENFEEEKNYTVVSEQVGEEEEEEEENEDNAENNKEKEPEDDVNYEMDVDSDSEQQLASKTALHEQQQMTLQGGVPVDELQAALPHTINANSSVVVHETIQNSDSECSVPGTPPPASLTHNQQQHEASLPPPSLEAQQQYQDEQQQMMAQMSGEITPMMESNFIDLTKLQKGQAHAKGCETLLGIKDKEVFGNKKCLVLDLDETLVHSSFKYVRAADFVIPVEIDNQVHNVYVIKRPGVDKFLETVAKYYEVVVFTASVSRYGDPLLDILDNVKTNHGGKLNIHHRLFRDSCYTYEGNYVKNLSQIGRPLEDIIILDNSPASYIFHPQHAVPISSWFSDTHDNELIDILPILTDLSGVPDVSMVLDVSL